jgi:hypothetical protein
MKHFDRMLPLLLGGAVALYSVLRFDGGDAFYRLWYYVPAAMALGCLLADRGKLKRFPGMGIFLDSLVAAVCLSRPLFGWPPVSGHALFFVYALFTGTSGMTRVAAVILGLITLYAKIWLWHGDATLWPGLMAGIASGWMYRRVASEKHTSL